MASFGGERRRNHALVPQAFFDGAPGCRELHEAAVQGLHLRQDEIGLRLMQFAYEQGNHLAAAIREDRERKHRRFDPEIGSSIEGILLADEQRIANFETVGKLQHFVTMIDGDAHHAEPAARPFGVQALEQRYFA